MQLGDGVELPSPNGLAVVTARPLALAYGDFNEDGAYDLVCGYSGANGASVAIYLGNTDAVYPNFPEARDHKIAGTFHQDPFLPDVRVFDVPVSPDFVGAGDFDGDNHMDVVVAAKGGEALHLLAGDGLGAFSGPRAFPLPGPVTALAAGTASLGDWNADLFVGVTSGRGARLLEFDGQGGALNGPATLVPLPAAATAIALGRVDFDASLDVAVAAGPNVVLCLRGVDRAVTRRSFPAEVTSVAISDFSADQRPDVAALSAEGTLRLLRQPEVEKDARHASRWASVSLGNGAYSGATQIAAAGISNGRTDDLVVVEPSSHRMRVLVDATNERTAANKRGLDRTEAVLDVDGEPSAVLPVNLNQDNLNDLVLMRAGANVPAVAVTATTAVFTVTNNCDNGNNDDPAPGSLRAAIIAGNGSSAASYTIQFSLDGLDCDPNDDNDARTIPLLTSLPPITKPATLDATDLFVEATGTLGIEITKGATNASVTAFGVTANRCVIRGIAFTRLSFAIQVMSNDNVIGGNYVGSRRDGLSGCGFGNTQNVELQGGRSRNLIGERPSSAKVRARLPKPSIGNSTSSGGLANKAGRESSATGSGNMFLGNFLGLSSPDVASPDEAPLDSAAGVFVGSDSRGNFIGGTAPGAGNVITNTGVGVKIDPASSGNRISRNSIYCNGDSDDGDCETDGNGDGIALNDTVDDHLDAPTLDKLVVADNGNLYVRGNLQNRPDGNYTLEFFSNSLDSCLQNQGETFLGAAVVKISAANGRRFTVAVPGNLSAGAKVTATATDASGSTSEFSAPQEITTFTPDFCLSNATSSFRIDSTSGLWIYWQQLRPGLTPTVLIETANERSATLPATFATTNSPAYSMSANFNSRTTGYVIVVDKATGTRYSLRDVTAGPLCP